ATAPRAMVGMASTIKNEPKITTGRAPRRITSGPEDRIPSMEPIDRPNSTRPISAVEASSRSRTAGVRSEEHTSELQSRFALVCRLLLENINHLQWQIR